MSAYLITFLEAQFNIVRRTGLVTDNLWGMRRDQYTVASSATRPVEPK